MPFPDVGARKRFILLTTYRQTGTPVPTPVWFARSQQALYFVTHGCAGKVKRIRSNPDVTVAPCSARGHRVGAELAGQARQLVGDERRKAGKCISRRYFFLPTSLIEGEMRRRGGGATTVYFEVTPRDVGGGRRGA